MSEHVLQRGPSEVLLGCKGVLGSAKLLAELGVVDFCNTLIDNAVLTPTCVPEQRTNLNYHLSVTGQKQ